MVKKRTKAEDIDLDDVLDDLDDAEADSRRPKLKTGRYPDLTVEKVQFKDGHNGLSFIIEAILGADANNGDKEGRKVSLTINGWDKKDQVDRAKGRLKVFLGAVFKKNPASKQEWSKIAKLCCQDVTKIAGRKFACEAEIIDSNGHDFVRWEPEQYEETAAEDAAE